MADTPSMVHGGKRPGAGRKRGVVDRVHRLTLDVPDKQVVADYLLGIVKNRRLGHKYRLDAARILMPYCHRKLPAAIEHSGANGVPLALVVDTHLVRVPDQHVRTAPEEGAVES
jgi:hypothetical protein